MVYLSTQVCRRAARFGSLAAARRVCLSAVAGARALDPGMVRDTVFDTVVDTVFDTTAETRR